MALAPLDLPGRRRLLRRCPQALILGHPDLTDPGVVRSIQCTRPDVLLSFFWPNRIPALLLKPLAFGTHPSLLPRWRGPDPYFWSILAGDEETGVTLHSLESEYDTGEVFGVRRLPLRKDETAWSLARKLDRPALELLCATAHALQTGQPMESHAQRGTPSWAGQPKEHETAIDWKRPAPEVERLVRACHPVPGAEALLRDVPAIVTQVCIDSSPPPLGLRVGEAWRSDSGWAVRCGVGAVCLKRVEDDAGTVLDLDTVFAPEDQRE